MWNLFVVKNATRRRQDVAHKSGNCAAGVQENRAPSQSAIGEKSLAPILRGGWLRLPDSGTKGEESLSPSQSAIGERKLAPEMRGTTGNHWKISVPSRREFLPSQNVIGEKILESVVQTGRSIDGGNPRPGNHLTKGKRPVSQSKCDW